jgi:hypothetical protein
MEQWINRKNVLLIKIQVYMKKVFNKFDEVRDSSGKVMETGDHFKNGASPKSLMSRGN